jgi:hypothetical protein
MASAEGQQQSLQCSMAARYMCGWYSIMAPVAGLPIPLGLWNNGKGAGSGTEGHAEYC